MLVYIKIKQIASDYAHSINYFNMLELTLEQKGHWTRNLFCLEFPFMSEIALHFLE